MLKHLAQDRIFKLVTLRGTPVCLQVSFFLLPLWAAGVGLLTDPFRLRGAAFMALFMLLLYVCALFHELGHILPATFFGAAVARIRLSGLGAFVQVESRAGSKPTQHLLTALGGPAVSALLSAILCLSAWQAVGTRPIAELPAMLAHKGAPAMLLILAAANVLLTLFSLLPMFPMDGGQAISAVLAHFLAPTRATLLIADFGQLVAIASVPVVLILSDNFLLTSATALIAFLVFPASARERRESRDRLEHLA